MLAPLLQSLGHDVTGLDNNLFEECTLGPATVPVAMLEMDVRDVGSEHLASFDAIIHLAAISNDPVGDLNPEWTREVNLGGSVGLARAAQAAGVGRFLFSSSCSLYGAAGQDFLDESAEFNPVTVYGESKVMAEQEIRKLSSARFSPVFLRNATAYGFSPRLRGDLVVNSLVGHAVTSGRVLIKSDGTPWRPLVHVRDICGAFIAMLDAPAEAVHGRAFNVGQTSENYQVRQVAELVRQAVPGSRVEYESGAAADTRNYRVNCDRIKADVPGFKPAWRVEDGIRELRDAYREYGLTEADLTGPRFSRIERVKQLKREGLLDESFRRRPIELATPRG